MYDVDVSAGGAAELPALVAACQGDDGAHPFGRDLAAGAVPEPQGERRVLLARGVRGVAGAALLDVDGAHSDLRLAVLPAERRRGAGAALAVGAVGDASDAGVDLVRAWAYQASPAVEGLSFRAGFALGRRILRLERSIGGIVAPRVPAGYEIGTDAEDDVAGLVAVNNAAFAWHPGQGALTAEEFRRRMGEPWFDREGFLVARTAGDVAGFCWTRLHGVVPPVGEIHVVCVAPGHEGGGLGRALVLAGLQHLSGRVATGMLYVDELNLGARRLYADLGFHVVAVDACYVRDLTGGLEAKPRAGLA